MEQNGLAVEESARARWSRIIDQQRSSGLPVAVFCRERSLPVSSYYGWRRKLSGDSIRPGFIEARVVGEADAQGKRPGGRGSVGNPAAVKIELSDGRRILVTRGFDRQALLEVIDALEGIAASEGAAW